MPIYAKVPESKWPLAPEGLHQAVCVDVWEPWTEERPAEYGGGLTDKTRIVWQLEDDDEETGKRMEVSQIYTLSLHEKSNLCKHLESWRGRAFKDEEKATFDIETLIGVNCQLQVTHRLSGKGKTYANVSAIVPLGKGQVKIRASEDFIRRKDRKPKTETVQQPEMDDSDDVPFVVALLPILTGLLLMGGIA